MRVPKYVLPLLVLMLAGFAMGADPALQSATRPGRPAQEVLDKWKETSAALRAVLPSPQAVADPEVRKQTAPAALPLLRQALSLTDELYQVDPGTRERTRKMHYHLLAIMAFLGDGDAVAELSDARQSNHKEVARAGRHAWYLSQWWSNAEDPKRSAELLDELEGLAKESPDDDDLTNLLVQIREEGTATAEQSRRIEGIIGRHLRGPFAQRVVSQLKAAEKRRGLVGKPLVLAATTLAGKAFTTEALKGKTILVHFGATWCIPWEQEHNRLLEYYPDVDGRYLAIVTVLCDNKRADLETYLQRHKDIPWTVIRDGETEGQPQRPGDFAAQYGVEDFPTTMVIGPDGRVQEVDVTPNAQLIEALQTPPRPASTRPAGGTQRSKPSKPH